MISLPKKSEQKAFTLIETLVAIVIFTLSMGAVSLFVLNVYKTYGYAREQSFAIGEAQRGVDVMIREIREAKSGENGAYLIEKAGDKEFVFYSDIDNDGKTERVRYFLTSVRSGNREDSCVVFTPGGSCGVIFSDFLQGNLLSASLRVSVEGDMGLPDEYAEVFVGAEKLGNVCQGGCSDCAATWQGTTVYDISDDISENFVQFFASLTPQVDAICDWEEASHAMKARFELSWTEEIPIEGYQLKKGVTKAVGSPVQYPQNQEVVSTISSYVRNEPPLFEYFDEEGSKIDEDPARLIDTKLIKIFMVVDVNPEIQPTSFELESSVQLRNLKKE